eukprot:SM000225S07016  [mRNA]  locus=s225:40861:44235:- [translate_table: standard]
MASLWGHRLAAGVSGRGRGSRALLRQARSAALLHDASYYVALQLNGPQAAVLAALAAVVAEPQALAAATAEAGGHSCELHRWREAPRGALSPASAAWRPPTASVTAPSTGSSDQAAAAAWVWMHVAAHDDALAALGATCAEQVGSAGGVECWSRARELLRLEVMGSGAEAALRRALRPASTEPDIWSAAASAPSGAVLGAEVDDPRDPTEHRTLSQPAVGAVRSGELRAANDPGGGSGCGGSDCSLPALSDSAAALLWAPPRRPMAGGGSWPDIPQPLPDSALCERRRRWRRLATLHGPTLPPSLPAAGSSDLGATAGRCPVVAVRITSPTPGLTGYALALTGPWALVLPAGWGMAFWVPLVLAGCHALGLRERRWLHTDAGRLLFPYDHPDCPAYTATAMAWAAECAAAYEQTPKSKRLALPPRPPDWPGLCCGGGPLHMACTPEAYDALLQPLAAKDLAAPSAGSLLVPVLVRLPRRGAAVEGAELAAPTAADLSAWQRWSPRWQGAVAAEAPARQPASPTKAQRKRRALKTAKVVARPMPLPSTEHPTPVDMPAAAEASGRELAVADAADSSVVASTMDMLEPAVRPVVGYVTSAAPRGSPAGDSVAHCEVQALQRMLHAQINGAGECAGLGPLQSAAAAPSETGLRGADDLLCGRSIMVLVRKTGSPMYRPALLTVLVTAPLRIGPS